MRILLGKTSLGKSGERLEKPGPEASITLNKGERGHCLGCGIRSLRVKDPLERNPVFPRKRLALVSLCTVIREKCMGKVSLGDGFQSVESRALSQLSSSVLEICKIYFYCAASLLHYRDKATLHSSTWLPVSLPIISSHI